MPGPLTIRPGVVVPSRELSWRFSHSGGPGGQSVNTSDTRVELSLDVSTTTALTSQQRERALSRLASRLVDGVITVTASEHRSQLRNRDAAEKRVAETLAQAVAAPPKRRRPTKATKGSVERRISEKKRRGQVKKLRRGDLD